MIHVKKASVLFKGQICNVILQACELLGGNLNRTQLFTIMVFFFVKKRGSAPTRLFSVSTLYSASMEVENYVKIFHISEDDEEVSEIRRKQFLTLYYNINKVNASNEKKFHDSAEWIPSSEDVASKFDGGCKKVVVQFEENNFFSL